MLNGNDKTKGGSINGQASLDRAIRNGIEKKITKEDEEKEDEEKEDEEKEDEEKEDEEKEDEEKEDEEKEDEEKEDEEKEDEEKKNKKEERYEGEETEIISRYGRVRKNVQFLIEQVLKEKKPKGAKKLEVPDGVGVPLGKIPNIAKYISQAKDTDPLLKKLHAIVYKGYRCNKFVMKKNLRLFKGFDKNGDEEIAEIAHTKLMKLGQNELKSMAKLFNLEYLKMKEDFCDQIVEFLSNPQPLGKSHKKKGSVKKKKKTKEDKTTKKKKMENTGPKKPKNSYMLFADVKRAEVKEKHPNLSMGQQAKVLGEMWSKLSYNEKQAYQVEANKLKVSFEASHHKKNEKTKKKNESTGPKGPKNSYFLFADEKRDEVKEKHPNLSTRKILGKMWSKMSDDEKKPYRDEADKLKASFEALHSKKNKKSTRPKRTKNSYMIFLSEKRAEIKEKQPGLSMAQQAKIFGEMWSKMSDDEKKPYRDEADKLKASFKALHSKMRKTTASEEISAKKENKLEASSEALHLKKRKTTASEDISAKKEKKKAKKEKKLKEKKEEKELISKGKSDIEQQIKDEIIVILKKNDLDKLSMKKIRVQLREKFGDDSVNDRKRMIKDYVISEVTKL